MQYWIVPCKTGIYDIDKAISANGGYCWWRQSNDFAVGDVVFIYITKPVQAIRYHMEVTAAKVRETKQLMPETFWKDKSTYYLSIGSNKLARFELKERYPDSKFTLSILQKHGLKHYPQSVRTIDGDLLKFLLHNADDNEGSTLQNDDLDPAGNPDLGTDYASEDNLWEGAVESVFANRYERNREAREECIRLKGCRCAICGFDFEEAYGPMGKNFIHIHHVVPISSIGKEYKLNVATDLIPVCPNCHAMLHSKPGAHEAYMPEELRTIIRKHLQKETGEEKRPIHIGKLYKIEDDKRIITYISERLETLDGKDKVLTLVSECFEHFGESYPNMGYKDWLHVINDYIRAIHNIGNFAAELEI